MNTTAIGRQAEDLVAAYLQRQNCQILAQNWRTRWCEVDLIAKKGQRVYFVEVRYRRNQGSGSGLESITPQKLRRMERAAQMWLQRHPGNLQPCLVVAEVAGTPLQLTALEPIGPGRN